MARNYSGDKAYQREVRARGGHRTEADYRRYQARKNSSSGNSYSIPKKSKTTINGKIKKTNMKDSLLSKKESLKNSFHKYKIN